MNKQPGFFDCKNAQNVLAWRRKMIELEPGNTVTQRFNVDHILAEMHILEVPTYLRREQKEPCMFHIRKAE